MFSNLKVVEFASVLAGPLVGTFFAELGAKVIKVENPEAGGDVTRQWKLASEQESPSAYYAAANYGKESVFINLKSEEGKVEIQALIKSADVIISNFRNTSAEKIGLAYEQVKLLNPNVVFGLIEGFGNGDKRPAFDVVLQAETGFMSMNGEIDSSGVKMPLALIDVLASHQLKEGLLLALLKKSQTGEGCLVTASLFDSAIASLINQATNFLMNGVIPKPMGSLHPNIAPYGESFDLIGGSIVLAIGNDQQFLLLCELLGAEELANDDKFETNNLRVINRKELYQKLNPLIGQQSMDAFVTSCSSRSIPIGRIKNLQEVFESTEVKSLLLTEMIGERITIRPKTIAFELH